MATKIGRNTLADGKVGRFWCKGANAYKQDKLGDGVKIAVENRLTVFNGVVKWTYTLILDQSSVKPGDYVPLYDANGKEVPGFDPSLETTVRYYWWAHTVLVPSKDDASKMVPKLIAGRCPLPNTLGATWLPREEVRRLDTLMGRTKGEAEFPLPVWVKVEERRGYNNPVSFGDESIKHESRRAAEMADEVDDGDDYAQGQVDSDAVDDEPADDVPTIQRGEAEHVQPDPVREQGSRRKSRSS